eukprot:CAMPEP_0172843776 /NCGR_PEP_ID=MMETSP1075-20121228/31717_1 /TAXON_ID=2916 /ORGANISM="Ceratium fusus, Strain PA161109" /LENGTH=239 /DNA_ID=CAMNT_0013688101 /DNA_START=214 /DNA_END=930 /DNA_ORIENTATION=-
MANRSFSTILQPWLEDIRTLSRDHGFKLLVQEANDASSIQNSQEAEQDFIVPIWSRSEKWPLWNAKFFGEAIQDMLPARLQRELFPRKFSDFTPFMVAGVSFVLGGEGGYPREEFALFAFGQADRKWKQVSFDHDRPYPRRRSLASACEFWLGFFMHGGRDIMGATLDDAWIFELDGPVHGVWTEISCETDSHPLARQGHAAVALSTNCLLIHGGDETVDLFDEERLEHSRVPAKADAW